MLVHIALYRWRPGVSPEEIELAMREAKQLKHQIDSIVDIKCGTNFHPESGGHTHAIVATFKDRSGLDTYRRHPAHEPVAQKLAKMEESGIGIDFED